MELPQIVTQIKQATDYQVNKRILREKIQTDLHLPYDGGLFKITPELYSFVSVWPTEFLFLEDVYGNPIQIEKQTFLARAGQCYHKAMNRWHEEHEQLKKLRKI
jgi:hypothetical protein